VTDKTKWPDGTEPSGHFISGRFSNPPNVRNLYTPPAIHVTVLAPGVTVLALCIRVFAPGVTVLALCITVFAPGVTVLALWFTVFALGVTVLALWFTAPALRFSLFALGETGLAHIPRERAGIKRTAPGFHPPNDIPPLSGRLVGPCES
jgi:hypothetical protein